MLDTMVHMDLDHPPLVAVITGKRKKAKSHSLVGAASCWCSFFFLPKCSKQQPATKFKKYM